MNTDRHSLASVGSQFVRRIRVNLCPSVVVFCTAMEEGGPTEFSIATQLIGQLVFVVWTAREMFGEQVAGLANRV